jgi:hypothetical protein
VKINSQDYASGAPAEAQATNLPLNSSANQQRIDEVQQLDVPAHSVKKTQRNH